MPWFFYLRLGVPPLPELGGSGFRIGPDPSEGVSGYSREMMKVYLARQTPLRPGPS